MKITREQAIKLIRDQVTWNLRDYQKIDADNFRLRIEITEIFLCIPQGRLYFCNELISEGRHIYDEYCRIINQKNNESQEYRDLELKKLLDK